MAKPKEKQTPMAPGHVNHLRTLLRSARTPGSQIMHPLMVPQPPSPKGGDDQVIPAKGGEYVIPKEVVDRKGTQFFDNLVKNTLKEVMPPELAEEGGTGTPETGFRWGGEIPEGGAQNRILNTFMHRPMAATSYQEAVDPDPFHNEGEPGGPGPVVRTDPRGASDSPTWDDAGLGPREGAWFSQFGNPWINFNATAPWGNTSPTGNPNAWGTTPSPTFWNPQGIPYAPPAVYDPGAGSVPYGVKRIQDVKPS